MALAHARYRYDGLDLILDNVPDSKVRGASQEIFAVASEKMNTIDDMLDEFYRQLSAIDRALEARDASQRGRNLYLTEFPSPQPGVGKDNMLKPRGTSARRNNV